MPETYYIHPRGQVTVEAGNLIASGGQGSVYSHGRRDVAKLFHEPRSLRDPEGTHLLNKLEALILAAPPTQDTRENLVLAWPRDVLFTLPANRAGEAKLAGYTMPRVGGSDYLPIFHYWNRERRNRSFAPMEPEALRRLLEMIASNLMAMLKGIHSHGFVLGDINEQNLLVRTNGHVAVLDADSFQVGDQKRGVVYPCPVGREEYTDPGLLGLMHQPCRAANCLVVRRPHKQRYGCILRDQAHDQFALAVVLFKLVMEDRHPFDGAPGDSFAERMRSRKLVCDLVPSVGDHWKKLHPDWQFYFRETFARGRRYLHEELPSPSEIFNSRCGSCRALGQQGEVAEPAVLLSSVPPSKPVYPATAVRPDPASGALPNAVPTSRLSQAPTGLLSARTPFARRARTPLKTPSWRLRNAPPVVQLISCRHCSHQTAADQVFFQNTRCMKPLSDQQRNCRSCNRVINQQASFCRHCGVRQ